MVRSSILDNVQPKRPVLRTRAVMQRASNLSHGAGDLWAACFAFVNANGADARNRFATLQTMLIASLERALDSPFAAIGHRQHERIEILPTKEL